MTNATQGTPSIKQYWAILENVDKRYGQWLLAKDEAVWCQSKEREAQEICKKHYSLPDISSIQVDKDSGLPEFTRKALEEEVSRLRSESVDFTNLEKSSSQENDKLEQNIESYKSEVARLEREIDSLKTEQLKRVSAVVLGTVLVATFTGSLIGTSITAFLLIIVL
jgi:chromosome segregation ATPase